MTWYKYRARSGEVQGSSVNQYPTLPVHLSQVEDPSIVGEYPGEHPLYDGTQIRQATTAEVAGFPAANLEDDKDRTRASAEASLTRSDDGLGMITRALALVVLDEVNILRSQHALAPRTAAQLKGAIKNKITSKDAD